MRIMILGGSNSSPKHGWAAELAKIAPEHVFDNKFLGAVGSLFGLLRLLKMARDGDPRPDAIIFEYTLNDTVWLAGESLDPRIIADTLSDVLTFCARERIAVLFLCLCLRPHEGQGEAEGSLFLDNIYRAAAEKRGAACLFLSDILGHIDASQYVDHKHLDAASFGRVAQAVAERLRKPIPTPRGPALNMRFCYADATQASISGPVSRLQRSATVFEGAFVEIARGGGCQWNIRGRLVAALLRSTEQSGCYAIRAGDRTIRKNAQSLAREAVENLIILHYVAQALPAGKSVVFDMPASESALMGLPDDLTLMEGPAHVPFEEQTLEIAGIMVYRPPSLARRVYEALLPG
ncbi:hypothetical protein [Methylocystis sp. Sn-Cys]|uniref:hypothetical protein n=1 Tax=Methylocystis sp. Sn-Cys TaxID=1701263 RepID=UPI0019227C1A|nr:hypothetical protein [Methylocystis sp. Sn-Cys]MBL1256157.1 hypothetical protein [Methylocystis sp. Sn-Cys]